MGYFEFLEIHRCPEGVEIGSKQLIFEFWDLKVDFWVVGHKIMKLAEEKLDFFIFYAKFSKMSKKCLKMRKM